MSQKRVKNTKKINKSCLEFGFLFQPNMIIRTILVQSLIQIVVANSFLAECDFYKLEDAKRKFRKCDDTNLIVEKLRDVNKREDFWCVTFAEDVNEVEFEIDFSGPWAIEAVSFSRIIGFFLILLSEIFSEELRNR